MGDKFHDYLRDVPMEIGKNFYPAPIVNLPVVQLPKLNEAKTRYSFETELRARRDYAEHEAKEREASSSLRSSAVTSEQRNGPLSAESSSSSIPHNSPASQQQSSHIIWSNEVLQPSKAELPIRNGIAVPSSLSNGARKMSGFDEFETAATVFDELEWKTIDDKAVLLQVLGASTATTSSLPSQTNGPSQSRASVELCSKKGSVSFSQSAPFSSTPPPTTSATSALQPSIGFSTPIPQSAPVVSILSNPNTSVVPNNSSSSLALLRVRLLTKGYKDYIVNSALDKLPPGKLPFVEYYMKGMRTLEKVGVSPELTLDYLIRFDLQEKEKIVEYSSVAAKLVGMGFTGEQCLTAVQKSAGNQIAALEILLTAK